MTRPVEIREAMTDRQIGMVLVRTPVPETEDAEDALEWLAKNGRRVSFRFGVEAAKQEGKNLLGQIVSGIGEFLRRP